MANIKLKDHYWETEGIYDAAQSKTQKAINADIAEVAQNNSDLIILSNTQPSATGNKIWIKEGVSYQIPVMDDLISNNITNNSTVTGAKVTDALNTLGSNVSALQGTLTSKLFIKSGTISSAHTSSTTTTLATDTSKINANTDIANVWFVTPANITSDYTITTNASGQVQITCTNSAAVTVYVVLFNP